MEAVHLVKKVTVGHVRMAENVRMMETNASSAHVWLESREQIVLKRVSFFIQFEIYTGCLKKTEPLGIKIALLSTRFAASALNLK